MNKFTLFICTRYVILRLTLLSDETKNAASTRMQAKGFVCSRHYPKAPFELFLTVSTEILAFKYT
jgi:hypothetical protein